MTYTAWWFQTPASVQRAKVKIEELDGVLFAHAVESADGGVIVGIWHSEAQADDIAALIKLVDPSASREIL